MNYILFLFALTGIVSIAALALFGRLIVTKVSTALDIPRINREAEDDLATMHEAKRRLASIDKITGQVLSEMVGLRKSIADYRKELNGPRRCRVDIVFEIGTPRVDCHLYFFLATRPLGLGSNASIREPDANIWRTQRIVRVWAQNARIGTLMTQQRFGSKREFIVSPIDQKDLARRSRA